MKRGKSVRYHNRVARRYDAIYDDAYWAFHDDLTWQAVRPHSPRDLRSPCLDLGCGTGKWGLKLLKSGYSVAFVDHAPAMIGRVQEKLATLAPAARTRATTHVLDLVSLNGLPDDTYGLTLAMGDPLSICADPVAAAGQMFRVAAPGGVMIATADATATTVGVLLRHVADAPPHARGESLDELDAFVRTRRTQWVTDDERERFPTTTFTPSTLRRLFERAGFEVFGVTGKTILPVRECRALLNDPAVTRRLLRLEQTLSADESTAAAASHLQIVARKPPHA